MKLGKYLERPDAKTLQQLAEDSKVSYQTMKSVARGMTLKMYDVADAVSKACGLDEDGKPLVSIDDLCRE